MRPFPKLSKSQLQRLGSDVAAAVADDVKSGSKVKSLVALRNESQQSVIDPDNSEWEAFLKGCGANAPGGGGFQKGNDCASGGKGKDSDRKELKNGKGIARKDMPQIRSDDMKKFETFLRDQSISITDVKIEASKILPVQSEISKEKTEGMVFAHELGTFDVTKKPVLLSNDNYLMDGHHRWAASDELGLSMNGRMVDLPSDQLLEMMEQFPASFKEGLSSNRGIDSFQQFDDDVAYPPMNDRGVDTQQRFSKNGKYTPERKKLHDEIAKRMFDKVEPAENPVFVIMGGGPASGKSTLIREGYFDDSNMVTVNSDDIKKDFPEYQKGSKLQSKVIASYVHEESSELSKNIMRQGRDKSVNVVLDGTGDSTIEKLKEKITAMKKGGMKSVAQYVTVDTEEAVRRNNERYEKTGRYVPEAVVRKTHAAVANTLKEAIDEGLFDEFTLWDTNDKTKKIAEGAGKELNVLDQKAWDKFVAKGGE